MFMKNIFKPCFKSGAVVRLTLETARSAYAAGNAEFRG